MQLFVQRRLLARDTLRRRVWVSSAALLNLKPQKRCLAAVPSLNDAGPTPGRGRPKNDLKKPIQVLSLPSLKQRVSIEELPSQDKLAETVGEPLVDSDEDTSRFLATPLLREIAQLESQYPDHLILVQVGSFYEIYETQKLSKDKKWGLDEIANFLNLRIAKKKLKVTAGSAMDVLRFAGFPMTKAKEYIDLLLRNGFTVAIADQTARDTSSKTKNFVRSVTRIITPGTQLQDELELDLKDNNFLLSVDFLDSNQDLFKSTSKVGLAWTDVSTGEFYVAEIPFSRLEGELSRIQPSEILLSEVFRSQVGRPGHPLYKLFNTQDGSSKEFFVNFKGLDIFDVSVQPFDSLINKDGLKIGKDFTLAEARVGSVLLNYLYQSFPCSKPSLRDPVDVSQEEHMVIDHVALQALEISRTARDRSKRGSLLHIMDKTLTAMGGRLLASRIKSPSLNIKEINKRLDLVQAFYNDSQLMHDIRNVLIQVKDLERSLQRIHLRTAGPSDLLSIVSTLQNALEISRLLSLRWSQDLAIEYSLKSTDLISSLVKKYDSFFEEEAFTTNKFESAGLIRDGVSDLLDEARQHHLNLLGEKEIMKEKLSKIFTTAEFSLGDDLRYGPIIILPKLNLTRRKHLMDILEHRSGFDFLKTNKKSTTSSQILTYQPWTNLSFAMREQENRMMLIERNLFAESCADLICHDKDILRVSRFLAEIDVSSSLGFIAKENRYTRPIIVDEPIHDVKGGRHPVVELSQLQRCQTFIKNDCHIGEREQLWLLTGANMGGKSTFLRQCALFSLLAQSGSFVPADYAKLGKDAKESVQVVDRVFSRVGASDDLSANQSTFMVEMAETSTILDEATPKSFVIMDEIGRGTSTLDGLSLAYAILHHLHSVNKCRGIFATHYHELAKMIADSSQSHKNLFERVACYQTAVASDDDGHVTCLYQIQKGIMDCSHGIQVAQKAGLPVSVVQLARRLYKDLEQTPSKF